MIRIKNVTLKNFLSVGNTTQAVTLDEHGLTLILGENVDQGAAGSRNGVGKAQPLHSRVLTPTGWKTMGEIEVGQEVITPSGDVSVVIGVFPQGVTPVYRLTFSDGRTAESCDKHLWKVWHQPKSNSPSEWSVTELSDVIEMRKKRKWVFVPLGHKVGTHQEYFLDPWFVGAMIGDGCLSQRACGFSSIDEFIIEKMKKFLPTGITLKRKSQNRCDWVICSNISQRGRSFTNPVKEEFNRLGLNGTSETKFIPDIYKNGSISQRIALLQGLIDTDGYVNPKGSISYTTVSERLALDVQEVVRSIGGLAKISKRTNRTYVYKGERRRCRDIFTVSIRYQNTHDLISLPRKKRGNPTNQHDLKLRIEKIERVEDQPTQCIMIDHPDHLYITDDYVVTHNTTIIQAICYALYGQPLTSIKRDNLVNKINQKAMAVSLDFEVSGKTYRIERGRKPNFLRFYVNDGLVNSEGTDEAHGENKITQQEIEKAIGMSHLLFKHVVALHTKTTAFLDMNAKDQREVIEELLGITQLSVKAAELKDLNKQIRDEIKAEEIRIKTVIDSNEKIQKTINDLKFKNMVWDKEHVKKLEKLNKAIDQLKEIDIETEISNQKILVEWNRLSSEVSRFERDASRIERAYTSTDSSIKRITDQLSIAEEKKCHTCGQEVHDEKHQEIVAELLESKALLESERKQIEEELFSIGRDLERSILDLEQLGQQPVVHYDTMEQSLNHRHTLDKLEQDFLRESESQSPYLDQVANLSSSALQDISYDYLNELVRLKEHQDFLLKLLTDKNSFIRKKIIDQNLSYLNVRLNSYLEKLRLPHEVVFQSDLSVEITRVGKEYDFAQLSNGEANRLVLALAWSFRDVWETMNKPLNLLMIDELVDSGLDSDGTDLALGILKKSARERGKNIFLISHKEGLESRVETVLKVIYENNFTSFNENSEVI